MAIHARDLYPILHTYKSQGDTATVKSLQLWAREFHLAPPQTAANDNTPAARPVEWETNVYEHSAEELVSALAEDKKRKDDPEYVPTYSTALHDERHHPHVRRAAKAMPVFEVDAEDEVIRAVDTIRMRNWLGCDAEVLDMAVEPRVTFNDVAGHLGLEGDDAAGEAKEEIREVAATFYKRAA